MADQKKAKKKAPKKETAIEPAAPSAPLQSQVEVTVPARTPPSQGAPVGFGAGGIEINTMSEVFRFAKTVIASGLAPKGFTTPEAVVIAIQLGAELGLRPMASLQSIAVINGRPSIWGDGMLAVCRASGLFDEANFVESIQQDPDSGELSAVCSCRRLPNGNIVTREFSMSDARQAKLTEKTGPWGQYTKRMLQMRARSWALRDAFGDVLRGILTIEEVQTMPPKDQPQMAKTSVSQLDELTEDLAAKDTPVATVEPDKTEHDAPTIPAADETDGRDFELTQ